MKEVNFYMPQSVAFHLSTLKLSSTRIREQIIYIIRICGLFDNVSMLVSIDIVFYGPQILILYIMIVEAPL
jgi:hypothetical protein